ncbi:uncharacterized protein MONOS_9080 [Monocercomonoides exilis]|uniref:uncharacterized protein n=1 Tax=Monocercomonoides exilis TaxID=2049356 RepID=UPI00355AA09D|nr:hypothetical protein MONOS_9080 [Monocercomonoides exilis]|eukprot:MONOS_9080.1-p1 / transcript=MONOS_9080.1 / gene=MONOS_9080 / organism=Monocercomonoides_exilis_PA203 / gene_product=unspecified product / transcript_product=unspecified product / location=Mono_scaffold00363:34294-35379(+) / protein_length=361 / sequence_SO=supercontig / SO=protein_coding / is_pseudo=false
MFSSAIVSTNLLNNKTMMNAMQSENNHPEEQAVLLQAFPHPSPPIIVLDDTPMSDKTMRLISHYIGRSVAYTLKYPFLNSPYVLRDPDKTSKLNETSPHGFNPLGYQCLLDPYHFVISSSILPEQVFQHVDPSTGAILFPQTHFTNWSPREYADSELSNSIAQNLYSMMVVMSMKMKMTETELLQALVLIERVLTRGANDIPFVLNQSNVAMALMTAILLVNKTITTDVPYSNSYWSVRFGFPLNHLNVSEVFMLNKLGWNTYISRAEWDAVVELRYRIVQRWVTTPPTTQIHEQNVRVKQTPSQESTCTPSCSTSSIPPSSSSDSASSSSSNQDNIEHQISANPVATVTQEEEIKVVHTE